MIPYILESKNRHFGRIWGVFEPIFCVIAVVVQRKQTPDMNIIDFRTRIDEALERLDRSEAWLARQLGYSTGQFSKWMSGSNRVPYEAVIAICERLELPPLQQVQLMDLAGYPPPRWARPRLMQDTFATIMAADGGRASDQVREFGSPAEYIDYMTSIIAKAKYTVDDLTWGIDLPSFSQREDDSYYEYLDTIAKCCQNGIIYREVMSFRNSRHFLDRANSMLQQNLITYNLRYYDIDLLRHPPLMSILVVDGGEAMAALYRWPYLPPHAEKRIATRQPAVVALFADYFDTVWFGAKPIKNGDRIDQAEFDKVRQLWE
jgi:hypothetical protein